MTGMVIILAMVAVLGIATFLKNGYPPWYSYNASVKGRLPSKVVFHQRSSSIEACLPTKLVFHQRLSSTEGHLPT